MIYDDDGLLPALGDKLYKDTEENEFLDDQDKVNKRAKDYAIEFYKDHSKVRVDAMYGPHYRIGQTLRLIDKTQDINENYFVESLSDNNGRLSLILAKYPSS